MRRAPSFQLRTWPWVSSRKIAYSWTASTRRRIWSAPVSGGDVMLDRSEVLDLDPHAVARREEARRVERHADARRRAGEDEVPGPEGDRLRQEAHVLVAPEDQVLGAGVLPELAVDPGAQLQVPRVGDLVGGGDPRAPRAEGVSPLGPRPLRLAPLQVAGADVVGDRVAGDAATRTHDDRELALVVQPPHDLRAAHRPAGRGARPRRLLEDDRRLGQLRALLGRVRRVVEADAEDRPRPVDRCQQAHVAQRPGFAARGGAVAAGQAIEDGRAVGERGDVVARDLAGVDG